MNTKTLIAGLAGGASLFLMGSLFYFLLLPDFFDTSIANQSPLIVPIVLGELVFGILLAMVFTRSGVSSLNDGAKAGAMIGALVALANGLILFGALDGGNTLTQLLVDAVVWGVRWGVAGAVIGKLLTAKEELVAA